MPAIPRGSQGKRKTKKGKGGYGKGDEPELTDEERKAKAQECKAQGNECFQKSEWLEAAKHFSAAIDFDDTDHVFFSNRSAAYANMKDLDKAISDAEECIRLKPEWAKGYSRHGTALFLAERYEDAFKTLSDGKKLEPTNAAILETLKMVEPKLPKPEPKESKSESDKNGKDKPSSNGAAPEVVIGIDLGTTYSCVSVFKPEGVEIIEDSEGNSTTPSYVGFSEDGQRVVGHAAKLAAPKNPTTTLFDVKRIIGQRWSDTAVREEAKMLPFKITEGDNGTVVIEVFAGGKLRKFTPEQVSAMVLTHMKKVAEARLGHPVTKAVVTVPAYFNDAQRQATRNAGLIAGLDVLRIINEPTAAALAYGLDEKAKDAGDKGRNILVFDMGGGTFDASLLHIEDGVFEVLSTGGDTRLGGEDFDSALVNHLLAEAKKKHNVDLKDNPKAVRKLRSVAESAKRTLSTQESMIVVVEAFIDGEDLSVQVQRSQFEKLNEKLFKKSMEVVKQVLTDGKMKHADIHDVVLVGGSTRIPKIQEMLSEMFGGKELCKSIHPDHAVAYGAAVQGAILGGAAKACTDISAVGAACQDIVLVDVTPLSLGIEVDGRIMSTIIKRNTSVPCVKKDSYTTTENFQTEIDIKVFEGERASTDGNHLLGAFAISGIQRAKKGEPKIEVCFELDASGILRVHARDTVTGARANITLDNATKGLDKEDIDRFLREAKAHEEEDAVLLKKLELKNRLEELMYDMYSEVDEEVRREFEQFMDGLQGRINDVTMEDLEAKQRSMQAALGR